VMKNGEAFDDTVEDGNGIRDDSGAIHLNLLKVNKKYWKEDQLKIKKLKPLKMKRNVISRIRP
jgi:hypothetical protein